LEITWLVQLHLRKRL